MKLRRNSCFSFLLSKQKVHKRAQFNLTAAKLVVDELKEKKKKKKWGGKEEKCHPDELTLWI